jgi:competence protein ComEC
MTRRSLGHRAPLLWLVLPLMAGLAVGQIAVFAPVGWLLGGALVAALAATAMAPGGRPRLRWAPALAVAMFLAGHAIYALHRARFQQLAPQTDED